MIRTAREIKSSLDIGRKQRALCRTFLTEQSILEELQREFGTILSEEEKDATVARERKSLNVRLNAIKKARLNLLKQKEKASLVMNVRNGSDPPEERVENENFATLILGY
jgi:hypothetical protein